MEIHPEIIEKYGMNIPQAMLNVASKLRSGAISADQFDMRYLKDWENKGSGVCLLAHIRLELNDTLALRENWERGLQNLFYAGSPSDPGLAANAIERYVYHNDQNPW